MLLRHSSSPDLLEPPSHPKLDPTHPFPLVSATEHRALHIVGTQQKLGDENVDSVTHETSHYLDPDLRPWRVMGHRASD